MKTNSFCFDLPDELIAQTPAERRDEARLLVSDRGRVFHRRIRDLPDIVPPNAVLVINDSRVRKARIYARRHPVGVQPLGHHEAQARHAGPEGHGGHPDHTGPDSHAGQPGQPLAEGQASARAGSHTSAHAGGQASAPAAAATVELLFLERFSPTCWSVIARKPGRNPEKRVYELPGGIRARMTRQGEQFVLEADSPLEESWFERYGHVPLPPYIDREDREMDEHRYQTVFAREPGSAAAPTAGLHLTESLLEKLSGNGTEIARVTLHVGAGTFAPVRSEDVESHTMHTERYEVTGHTAETVNRAKREGRPIVAVGTTCVRTLESAGASGELVPGSGESNLFIYPGYRFRIVDELLTNFHTPRSSLIMLVSAFAGQEHILSVYRQAVEMRYRFFSYGDATYLRP